MTRVTFYPQNDLYDGEKKIAVKDFGVKEGMQEAIFEHIKDQLYLEQEKD